MMRIAMVLLASLSCLIPGAAAADSLRVMTFNIRYGLADDGDDAWPLRKDKTVAAIREAAPDLFGVQECLDFQAEYLAEALPDYDWVGQGREADGGGEMCAVFYRKDRFEVLAVEHFWLSETPEEPGSKSWDSSLPRMATQLRMRDKTSDKRFYFINTHFDHRGEQARLESARLLARRTAALGGGEPIVVTGDFNALGDTSGPWKALTEGALLDAWNIAQAKTGPENTWNGFETPAEDAARRIDWILVSSGVAVHHCATLDQRDDGRYPSDHFPVLAQITLP